MLYLPSLAYVQGTPDGLSEAAQWSALKDCGCTGQLLLEIAP